MDPDVESAIRTGDVARLRRLLSPQSPGAGSGAFMSLAAYSGQLEVVQYLYNSGAAWDEYATEWAYSERQDVVLIWLVDRGCPARRRAFARYEKLKRKLQPRVKRAGPRKVLPAH